MTPALPAVSSDLDVQFAAPDADPIGRTLAALRAFRLVGFVATDVESRGGAVSATLGYVEGRGLLVDAGATVETTPAQQIVDALSARLGAVVVLDAPDAVFGAETVPASETAAAEGAADDEPAATTVFAVRGTLALAPDRRAELALQLESSLTAAPRESHTLVVPEQVGALTYWSRAQRPVIALHRGPHRLMIQLYGTASTRTGRMRDRAMALTIPDWMALWDPAPLPIVEDPRTPAAEVQQRLRHEEIAALGVPDGGAIAEAGIDGPRLQQLLGHDLDDRTVAEVVDALGLPVEVAAVLTGDVTPESLPGALRIERRSMGATVAEGLLAEPEGTSLWARWRRLPHRHPRAAVALIAAELALAAGMAAAAMSGDQPWRTVLWIVAGLLAVDAIGDALLLRRIRRRSRAQA